MKAKRVGRGNPPGIDMSPEAIDRRLRELEQLYELGIELRGARWLGRLDEIKDESIGDERMSSLVEPETS